MPTRLLLAAIILTNPIYCQMSGSSGSVHAEEPVAESAGCTCECGKDAQPASPSDDGKAPHRPYECPNCELCQCVCAGAVVKDTMTVDDSPGGDAVGSAPEQPVDASLILLRPAHFCDVQMACDDGNVGRSVRIRHGSLLC